MQQESTASITFASPNAGLCLHALAPRIAARLKSFSGFNFVENSASVGAIFCASELVDGVLLSPSVSLLG